MKKIPDRITLEEELWTYAEALGIRPMPGRSRPLLASAPKIEPPRAQTAIHHPRLAPNPPRLPALIAGDERRRLGRRGQSFDEQFDLHGLGHHNGHAALRSFLIEAQDRGARTVLVITGKSEGRGNEASFRRNVPFWFEAPGFAELVHSFAPAHWRHGGDGALYVRLRRRR